MTQKDLLKDLVQILNKFQIKYFVNWGTLLGFVRDGNFFKWDQDDIDLAIFEPIWNKYPLFESFINEVYAKGFHVQDASYNYLCLVRNGIHIDLHLMESEGKNYIVKVTGEKQTFSKTSIEPLSEIHLFDTIFSVPNDPTQVLVDLYGEEWNVPKPGNHTHYNSERINNFRKIVYPFIISLEE